MCDLNDRKNAVYKIVSENLNGDNHQAAYNKMHKAHLCEHIRQYSLCVGAGISADIHMKISEKKYLWNDLVYGIAEELFKEQMLENANREFIEADDGIITKQKWSEILTTSLKTLSDKGDFLGTNDTMECVEYLKSLIFSTSGNLNDFDSVDTLNENAIALIIYDLFYNKLFTEKKSLIKAIEDLKTDSKPRQKTIGGTGEGKTIIELAELIGQMAKSELHTIKVLTYNYDDYLEMTLRQILDNPPEVLVTYDTQTQRMPKPYVDELERSKVYPESFLKKTSESDVGIETKANSSVSVYHVHGYVPHYWNRIQMCGELVFSENSYNHMADEVYNWTNRIQAEIFSRDRVLFVGFSGVDTNFRRLMRELHKEWHRVNGISSHGSYNRHTMFMRYDDIIKNICTEAFYNVEMDETIMDRIAADIVLQTISAKDEYYREKLGIELIWYYKLEEIADVLHEVKLYMEDA